MTISPISDGVTRSLHLALDGLQSRGQAIAANIANLETPNYLARQVSFEDSLRSALSIGAPERMRVSSDRSMAPTRTNGNNVNIDFELLASAENVLREKLAVQALNGKYSLLRTAITGQ